MGGSGDPINYKELIPPETLAFRKALYNFLQPKMTQQMPGYPGTLPYTTEPDPGQMAGLATIMQMLGYGGYTWPGMPGAPASGGGGGGGTIPPPPPGGGPGGGGGTGGEPPPARDGYKPKRPGRRQG